jgi:hypothetical protein
MYLFLHSRMYIIITLITAVVKNCEHLSEWGSFELEGTRSVTMGIIVDRVGNQRGFLPFLHRFDTCC